MPSLDGKNHVTAVISISTTGPQLAATEVPSPGSRTRELAWLSLLPIAFGCVLIPKSQKRMLGVVTIMIIAISLAACGGASFHNKPPIGTPPGNYTLSIRATSGSLVHSAQVNLTVR
jgi:hypothetical protein